MAKATNKKSKFGRRSTQYMNQLKTEIATGRNNQYKYTALVMLDYLSRLPDRLNEVNAKLHYRGVHANSISTKAKDEIIEFMTTSNDVDPSDVRSVTYLGKIYGTSKGVMFHAMRKANKGKYGAYEKDDKGRNTKHFNINYEAMIKAIEDGKVVINIAGEVKRTVKGDGTNGTDPKKFYSVTADNRWADVDDKGNAKPIVKNSTSNKVEDCENELDLARVKAHWEKKLAEAQSALQALAVKTNEISKAA